jgi:phosphoglycolate phosphatase-like HAD superfamily hydrolase
VIDQEEGLVDDVLVLDLVELIAREDLLELAAHRAVEEAARIKLARADLNRFFSFGGYGSDSPDRTELTRKGLERASERYGEGFDPGRCFSCGDTPRDVVAGHGAGIRVVGVATGEFTVDQLKEEGADAAIGSFCEGLPLL